MSIISWNCQGLGTPWVVQALKKAIRKEDPSLVFLMETKLIGSEMKKLQEEVGLLQGLFVTSVGRKGGLALLWKFDIQVELRGLNQWFIDVFVNSGGEIGKWRLTGFYGNPETHQRDDSWALLERLGKQDDSPWVCITG